MVPPPSFANDPLPAQASGERAPYCIWSVLCPFRKGGSPVVGNMGSALRSVVIMDAETFKRLVAENPNLATAQFEVGTYE